MQRFSQNINAIFYILLAMFILALQDICIKLISGDTNLFLIFFFRSSVGIIVILLFLKFTKRPIILKTHYPILTLVRCSVFFIGFSCIFLSLSILTYPIAVTLFFSSPLFVTILSKIFLKKNIGLERWIALLTGFLGVYLVMNPEFNNFNIYTILPVLAALAYATTIVIQYKTANKDNLFAQTFHLLFAAALLSLIMGIVFGNGQFNTYESKALQFMFRKWEISFDIILVFLIAIGFAFSVGILILFQAYRIAFPPSIAPFEYILIIYALFFSWIIWGETIDSHSFTGLILIVGGGLYTFFIEIKRKQLVSIQKNLQ